MAERIDAGGNIILTKGLYGGYQDRVPTGVKLIEHENPASSDGRQRFFYSAVRELTNQDWVFAKFWQPGGPVDTVMSELSFGVNEARRMGQISPVEEEEIKSAYEERAIAYFCMEGMLSLVQHSDGALINIVERMPPEVVMEKYGWNEKKSKLISHDPAVAWPLTWIRAHAESGALLRHFKNGTGIQYKQMLVDAMVKDLQWGVYRQKYGIADGVEKSLVHIAFDYWQLEDLPDFHRRLYKGELNLTDNVPVGGKPSIRDVVEPTKPNMGVLPYDDIYFSNIDRPVDVTEFVKRVFAKDPEILPLLHGFLTYMDKDFPRDPEHPDKIQGLQGRIPSELTVKDIDKWTKMQSALIGGPQAVGLADFSKFGEGLDALCNLYAKMPDPQRADVLGWMVGEIFYIKVRALMINTDREGFADQIFKIMNLGEEDTPKEIEGTKGGVLGTGGMGAFGPIARAVGAYGLNVGTEHYNDALAMLHTGIKNAGLAHKAQPLLGILATLNRLAVGGKRR